MLKKLDEILETSATYGIRDPEAPYTVRFPKLKVKADDVNSEFMNPEEAADWNRKIGREIDRQYDDPGKWTPMQGYRFAAWTVTAAMFTISVGVEYAYHQTHSSSLRHHSSDFIPTEYQGNLAIHAITLCSMISALALSCFTDLKSPKERQRVIEKIANQTFEQIATSQNFEDIESFGLLNTSEIQRLKNKWAVPVVYKKYQELETSFREVIRIKDEAINHVNSLYQENGGHLEEKIAEANTKTDDEGNETTTYADTSPSWERWKLSMGWDSPAQQRLTKWVDWKHLSHDNIYSAYKKTAEKYNRVFASQKELVMNE